MEEKNKEQAIADLYVLRGGLSAISQCTDLIVGGETDVFLTEAFVEAKEWEIDFIKKDKYHLCFFDRALRKHDIANFETVQSVINPKKEELKKQQVIYSNISKNICDIKTKLRNQLVDRAESRAKDQANKKLGSGKRLLIGGFCVAGLFAFVSMLVLKNAADLTFKNPLLYVLMLVSASLGFVPYLIKLFRIARYKQKWFPKAEKEIVEEEKEKIQKQLAQQSEAQTRIDELQTEIRRFEEARGSLEREKSEDLRTAEQELNELREKLRLHKDGLAVVKQEQTEVARVVYEALKNSYDELIAEDDWKNIDLIIFYLQSGRADTLKEALIQVDRQRQTESIVNAVNEANKAICREISSGVRSVSALLYQGFSYLGNQISAGFSAVGEELRKQRLSNEQTIATLKAENERVVGEIRAQSAIQSAQTERLISATQLNNALQEKANKKSDELLYDLRYNQRFWVK